MCMGAESSQGQAHLAALEQKVRDAMGLPDETPINFTDLHDALTTLRFHGKPVPAGLTPDLLEEVRAGHGGILLCCMLQQACR